MQVSAYRGAFWVRDYPPDMYRFVSTLPGFSKWVNSTNPQDDDRLMMAATARHYEMLIERWPDLEIRDSDGTLAKLVQVVAPVELQPRLLPFGSPQAIADGAAPWAHQERALAQAICREQFAFFHDTGTGKSATMVQTIVEQHRRGLIDRALVVTTTLGLDQFRDEQLPYWMPEGVLYRVAEVAEKPPSKSWYTDDGALLIGLATPGAFQSQRMANNVLAFVRGQPLLQGERIKFVGRGKAVPI